MNKDYQKITEDRKKLIQYIIGCIERNEFTFIKSDTSGFFDFETSDKIPFSIYNTSYQKKLMFMSEWVEFEHENFSAVIKEMKKKELLKQLEQL